MKHTDQRSESRRLEILARRSRRRGEPAEAARLEKAAALRAARSQREARLKQKQAEAKRAQEKAAQPYRFQPNYFQRRLYEIFAECDAELGTTYAADHAHWHTDEPYVPPPPSGKSQEELDAIRQMYKDKLDAIIADLEREAAETQEAEERQAAADAGQADDDIIRHNFGDGPHPFG
jgi:hypothetical protein